MCIRDRFKATHELKVLFEQLTAEDQAAICQNYAKLQKPKFPADGPEMDINSVLTRLNIHFVRIRYFFEACEWDTDSSGCGGNAGIDELATAIVERIRERGITM